MEPFGHELEHEQVETDGHEGIESDGHEETEYPVEVPVGVFGGFVGGIFLCHHLLHVLPFLLDVTQNFQIGVATIHEDARLNVVIALLGIVVHVFQTLLRHVVIPDVVLHLLRVFLHGPFDHGGQGQTHAAVCSCLFAHDIRGHGLQTVDKTIVTGYLATGITDKLAEGQLLALEPLVLFRSLVTGVGQVEQVFLLLGIEHEGVLVRLFHGLSQIPEHLLTLSSLLRTLVAEFLIVLNQFCAQYDQCRVEVFLLQHGISLTDHAQDEGHYDEYLLHYLAILVRKGTKKLQFFYFSLFIFHFFLYFCSMILIADSGSTKTDWALQSASGSVERFHTQGINPFHQDRSVIAEILRQELLPQLDPESVSFVCFYGSGVRPELEPVMASLLQEAFPQAKQVEAHSDLLGAARALCGHNYGIASILGTGANSCLYDGEAIVQNTPALGYILGDEGSGGVLGKHFLHELYKGILSENIRSEFEQEYGLTMADVIQRVYREPMPNRFLASLAPFIHRHLSDDAVRQIVINNFRDFFRYNIRPYGLMRMAVSCVGSVAWYFRDQLAEAAAEEGFTLGTVLQSPIESLMTYHLSNAI